MFSVVNEKYWFCVTKLKGEWNNCASSYENAADHAWCGTYNTCYIVITEIKQLIDLYLYKIIYLLIS